MMAEAVTLLAPAVGVGAACAALAVPRASWYRWSAPPATAPAGLAARPTAHPRALSAAEGAAVLGALHSARFRDRAPTAG